MPSLFQHLEQEKHQLRNQIEVMEEEYEQRISDLQTDLNLIRQRLQVSVQDYPYTMSLEHFWSNHLSTLLWHISTILIPSHGILVPPYVILVQF